MERGKESIAIKVGGPKGRCAHCTRVLGSGERLDVTFLKDGSLVTATLCRPCLAEHLPETLAELHREQPRRFR